MDNLRAGTPVLLVAPFTVERTADGWATVTGRLGAYADDVSLVWLHLPPGELVLRLRRRAAARDADKVRDPDAFLAAGRDPPAAPHLRVDATARLSDQVDLVLARLAR